jgi:hypothetical protein
MCPGVDLASKNEYQVNPGGKGGRCVRLDNLPFSCADVKKSGSLNVVEPSGSVQAGNGTAFLMIVVSLNLLFTGPFCCIHEM